MLEMLHHLNSTLVRITRKKGTFEKGFTPNWIEEVFTIVGVKASKPPTYTIKDALGEPIQGTFTNKSSNRVYRKFSLLNDYSRRGKSMCL